MNVPKQLLTIARLSCRHMSGTPQPPARIRRLKANQKRFQVDDGNPVFLKSTLDKLLYNATLFTTLFGVGWSVQTWLTLVLRR